MQQTTMACLDCVTLNDQDGISKLVATFNSGYK